MTFSAEPNVLLAQYGELKRQVPLLYTLLVLNAAALAYTHRHLAPVELTIGFTVLLSTICGWRVVRWLSAPGADIVTAVEAKRELVRTTVIAGVMSVAFVNWSFLLDQYGGPAERGHVALFIAVTVIGCIFCLVTLPQAAMVVTAAVTLPYLVYYILRGNEVLVAMALNIALVTGVMIRVLLNNFARFETLILSKDTLAAKQREAERLGDENALLAHTDALTGLPNRRHFFAELDRRLGAAKLAGDRVAVGVLDLDRFKPVNDTFGHAVGDRLLMAVGRRLAKVAGDGMLLARLGGDEFGILITRDVGRACELGQAICDRLAVPFSVDDHSVAIGCSAGLAIFPDAGETVHELFDRSDYALYHAKSTERGSCAAFSLEHETQIRSERAIEAALQSADLEDELHVRFQPILCTRTLAVLGVEALGRWTSPTIGAVSPDRFITTAERLGIIHSISATLFGKALAEFSEMPQAIGLSFNLSALDIVSQPTVARLIEMIERNGIDPKRITFELTETALMQDFDAAVRGIRSLRALGSRIALDDFGSGYSSLGYLRRLPLDKVKVDRTFVADMDEASGHNILTAILGLCQTLELDCIVEGVETDAQLASLRELGYRLAQGYLFAEPMRLDTCLVWMRRHTAGTGNQGDRLRPQLRIVA
ncbi:MAG: EAL domain-containing protein [Parvibaculaceae bacterium]|nr:EAL domain-containing protein [Parvibaculaceae bacterium]